jgi:hypothetical protein
METVFYSNEKNEPIHIHAVKSDMECKYWIDIANFEINEAFSNGLTPQARREIKQIIYTHFDYIIEQWNIYFKTL